jgi:hypothetical protein
MSFWPEISCRYAPGYIQTFISFTLFYFSNRRSSKKLTFVSCFVLTDFCHYLCLPLDRFLFQFFWSWNFWGSCYSSICIICGVFELKPKPKGSIYYYAYANVANRVVWSFVWRKFSSVGIGEWWDEIKNGQKLKLGDAHVTPGNIQEVQASKLGDAPKAPLLYRQKSGHLSKHYIFYCFMHYAFFLERLYYCF